jgi:hypothetical protein
MLIAVDSGAGLLDQRATAGGLIMGSSLMGATVSSVMWRARRAAHSSLCSSNSKPRSLIPARADRDPSDDPVIARLDRAIQSLDQWHAHWMPVSVIFLAGQTPHG